jgi:NADPH:quinone reductase-like Zn-dependent oxidoreductase
MSVSPGRIRCACARRRASYVDVYHRTGYYPQPVPFILGLEGAGTVEAIGQDVRSLKVGDRVAYAGPTGGHSEVRLTIAPVLLSPKGSLFLTRPILFHYIQRRDSLEASAKELFEVVASGKVRINVNQCFALKDAADAHKALETRATSGSTVLTI